MPPPADQPDVTSIVTEVQDNLFGTRQHTAGARLQLPRKVPLRIEPKTYFANERTFLAWLHMAVTLGGVGTALVGFTASEPTKEGEPPQQRLISKRTTDLITILLTPLAIVIIVYGLFIFYMRSKALKAKQVGYFQEWLGTAVIASLVMASLIVIMGLSIYEIAVAR